MKQLCHLRDTEAGRQSGMQADRDRQAGRQTGLQYKTDIEGQTQGDRQ